LILKQAKMARTIADIQAAMVADIAANETLSTQLTSTSKVAIWRLWTFIVATAIWSMEKIFDAHKSEVEAIIASKTPHRLVWYRDKARYFQYGYTLPVNSDQYTTIDANARIIKFAAVTEANGILKVKAAKDNAGSLAELSAPQIEAFTTYMARVKDAGVKLRIISQEADHLKLSIDLYYDPLVLDEDGARLDGTNNTPVQDAITDYLENLPFDGEFTLMALTDALQNTEGVKIPQILSAKSYWGAYAWATISAKYNPEAGWLKIYDNDLTITWIAYGADL
jgi:hypothetical protein